MAAISAGVTLAALSPSNPAFSSLRRRLATLCGANDPSLPSRAQPDDDPRVWLEEVEGEESLRWVRQRNAHAIDSLGQPSSLPVYTRILDILDSKEKIPYVGRVLNGLYYNFWQDERHVKGIWRRCSLDEYRKPSPAWETVLDLDALGKAEGVSWVWGGSTILDEGPHVPKERAMIRLSRGGSDATVARELDLNSKKFIPPADGGFEVPEAKTRFCYKDRDTLLIGGVFGEEHMTDSGYPRSGFEWKRGTPLSEAKLVYEGEKSDVAVDAYTYLDREVRYTIHRRAITFYTSEVLHQMPDGSFRRVAVQPDAEVDTFADQLLITLRSDWLGFEAGSLLATPALRFMEAAGDEARRALLTPLFTPSPTASLERRAESRHFLILAVLENVVAQLRFWRYDKGAWLLKHTYKGEGLQAVSASGVNPELSDEIWITASGYTQPTSYSLAHASTPDKQELLKALPTFYDASGLHTEQLFATSEDGTKVPYFLVAPAAMRRDGSTPTLLYGYGGFEISLTPGYIATQGVGWLEKGYAYVQANIRGGGEFGPKWHQAALKEKRSKAYEDFEAVARDLVTRGITSPSRLAVQGGSNGGLLTGNMFVRSPHLFGAILCQVPLLDMRRYHKLLAGASWMGEYGNPETDWGFLQQYSPYHNVDPAVKYPPILFTTSTRDDRVHPGHARKMVRKLVDLGIRSLYYENIEGGHGGAADNKQRAFMTTLAYTFLEQTVGKGSLGGWQAGTTPLKPRGLRALLESRKLPFWAITLTGAAAILGLAFVKQSRL